MCMVTFHLAVPKARYRQYCVCVYIQFKLFVFCLVCLSICLSTCFVFLQTTSHFLLVCSLVCFSSEVMLPLLLYYYGITCAALP